MPAVDQAALNAALSRALRANSNVAIGQVLRQGADPNAAMLSIGKGHEGGFSHAPCLLWAAARGPAGIVQLLLDAGANPDAPCDPGQVKNFRSPLVWAIRRHMPVMRDALLAAGARLDTRSADGYPLIIEVLEHGSAQDAECLTDRGMDWHASLPSPRLAVARDEVTPLPHNGDTPMPFAPRWDILRQRVKEHPEDVPALAHLLMSAQVDEHTSGAEREAFTQKLRQEWNQAEQAHTDLVQRRATLARINQAKCRRDALGALIHCTQAAWLRQDLAEVPLAPVLPQRPRL